MRAPGHPQGCFVTEVVIDDLAAKIGIDPLELRLKNLPPEAPDAQWGKYLRMGAEKFGWSKRHADGDPRSGPLKRGMGCAANRWGGGGRGTKTHVEILSDGSVTVRTGTQDIGTGTRTLIAMVAAETLGLPVDAIKVEIGDSNFPFSGGSGGSTTAASVTPSIRIVTGKAFDALAARIAPSLGAAADQLVARDGRITVKTDASKRLAWKEACKRLGAEPVVADGEWEPGLSASGTSGVQFAEVEVDVETGIARVTRMLCVQDAGLIVDPLTAESQCMGGIIGGIGYALFEHRILDRNTACMVNPNMEWYLVAGHSDIPQIDIVLVDQPERGVIGLGEPPTVSTAAAVTNAVSNAIGARIRHLPVTPESVLAAIAGKTGGTQ
jgi:xanthine dehydrogenase YagR molybdenum-binding subunit